VLATKGSKAGCHKSGGGEKLGVRQPCMTLTKKKRLIVPHLGEGKTKKKRKTRALQPAGTGMDSEFKKGQKSVNE